MSPRRLLCSPATLCCSRESASECSACMHSRRAFISTSCARRNLTASLRLSICRIAARVPPTAASAPTSPLASSAISVISAWISSTFSERVTRSDCNLRIFSRTATCAHAPSTFEPNRMHSRAMCRTAESSTSFARVTVARSTSKARRILLPTKQAIARESFFFISTAYMNAAKPSSRYASSGFTYPPTACRTALTSRTVSSPRAAVLCIFTARDTRALRSSALSW
mmetsp:Transcript_43156/g.137828  ORF Transcript_43156/g.137828 Transcript_43156/m.137828 type:complete len:226 (+) Transcript_43156:1014-1691(+)